MRAAQFRAIIEKLEAQLITATKHAEVEVMKRKQYEVEIAALRSQLGAALGSMRYHTEQTRPIQRTTETIRAIEHNLGLTDKQTMEARNGTKPD